MSEREEWEKKVMHLDLQKLWLKAITVTAKPKSKEMASPEFAVPKKPSGCFKFNDGTTQNWTLDQLYDSDSKPLKKIAAYFLFVLLNSQNLALAAFVDPLSLQTKLSRNATSILTRRTFLRMQIGKASRDTVLTCIERLPADAGV